MTEKKNTVSVDITQDPALGYLRGAEIDNLLKMQSDGLIKEKIILNEVTEIKQVFINNPSVDSGNAAPTTINGANVVGPVASATHATRADTANSIAAGNVVGTVANAAYAASAGSVGGANVSGYVANATHANIADVANSIAGANIVGTVANATYASSANTANIAYSISSSNVTGLGNIASLNLTGNTSTVLRGDGTFGSYNPFNQTLNTNSNAQFSNLTVASNAIISDINMPVNSSLNIHYTSSGNENPVRSGNIELTSQSIRTSLRYFGTYTANYHGISIDEAEQSIRVGNPGGVAYASLHYGASTPESKAGDFEIETPRFGSGSQSSIWLSTQAGDYSWKFDGTGTMSAPGAINAKNQVKIEASNLAELEAIYQEKLVMLTDLFAAEDYTGNGYPASKDSEQALIRAQILNPTIPSNWITAAHNVNVAYYQWAGASASLTANSSGFSILNSDDIGWRFDTATGLRFPDNTRQTTAAQRFNQSLNTNSEVTFANVTSDGNVTAGTIKSSGNLIVEGGIIFSGTPTEITTNANIIEVHPGVAEDRSPVVVVFDSTPFQYPIRGVAVIANVTAPSELNGTWFFEAWSSDQVALFTSNTYSEYEYGTGWDAYTGENGDIDIIVNNSASHIKLNSGGYVTTFTDTGNLILPTTLDVDLASLESPFNSNLQLLAGGNSSFVFQANGGIQFPYQPTSQRTGHADALLFGKTNHQKVIGTQQGTATQQTVERLVISGGDSYYDGTDWVGEGGDLYMWAGRGADGGDIKVDAGDAYGSSSTGGTVKVRGAMGAHGGFVEINAGQGMTYEGGPVTIDAGYGHTDGGAISLTAGHGETQNGGSITLQAGSSGQGIGSYGNIVLEAGSGSWSFTNDSNLTLPRGGVITETNIPFGGLGGGTIALKPTGGSNNDQQLLVYPTAGQDFNHLHLTSGNLWNTELFLGNDDFYVKLANTGNVVINANDSVGNTAQWTFGTEGTILNSGNLTLQTPSGVPSSVANWDGGGGWNQGSYTNLTTTGGTGTGLTVDVAAGGGGYINISAITIHTPGTGYTDGDVITINNENNIPGSFTIRVVKNEWSFDTQGDLVVAGNISYGGYASPAPRINGFDSAHFANSVIASQAVLTSGLIQGGVHTVVQDGINSIELSAGARMDVFEFPFTMLTRGRLTISGDISTAEALGTWYYQSINSNSFELYTDETYSTKVDASGWTAYTGGASVYITKNIPAANVKIDTNGFVSTFSNDGNLTVQGSIIAKNVKAEAPFIVVISDFEAEVGCRYAVDTYMADGPVTALLPANPNIGEAVFFADAGGYAENGSLTINASINTIMGGDNTMTVTTSNQSVGLLWNGRTWRIYNAG